MATQNRLNYSPSNHAIQVGSTNGGLTNLATGSTGQILQSVTGADPAYSTATYPSTASSAGKILRSDGTNWSATTATYPDTAGTSGNVLTSDGTNWSSSTPSSTGTSFFIRINNQNNFSPADSTTYYFMNGSLVGNTDATTAAAKFVVPTSCTMRSVYAQSYIISTLASNENVQFYIRVNATTDYTVSTSWQWTATRNQISVTGLSVSLSAGDYIQFKVITPVWGTNPTNVTFSGSVYFN